MAFNAVPAIVIFSDDKKPAEQPASSEPAQVKEPEPCFHRSSAILLAHRGVKPRELVVAKSSLTKRAPLVAAEETVTTSRVTGRSGPQMQHRKTHDNHRSSKKEESEDEAPRPDTVILVEMEEPNEMIVGYQSVADGTA
ncbi:hypothetical protein HPB52_021294 [Rhipicephalus sanguineus]|uniref:Uncharacterized protein n=1 Tax=Rhipicephalus sanguineus TaxID=34632 RepID=A0A9D4Q386_RHISA|nr:hypothetical protein HPB52_021294 [Rhipicephalus sanguineus]